MPSNPSWKLMSGVIDTNILLYAVNRDAPEHDVATRFLQSAGTSADSWYLTEGIFYEFFRVATHHRVFSRPLSPTQCFSFLRPFLEAPNFFILAAGDDHWAALREVVGELANPSGNLFFDIRTVALMREYGVTTIFSADTDFLQFKGIHVQNPILP